MKGIIYKYTNKINGKCYIGQTIHPAQRKSRHKTAKDNTYFHTAIRKYGFDNFKYEVLYEFDLPANMLKSTLNIMEIRMIEEHNAKYNLTKGGEGVIPTEETRKKMSEARKGKKHSKEWCKNMSEANRYRFKAIIQIDIDGNIINRFDSISLAAKILNTHKANIIQCLKGTRKKAGGYIWKYA